MAPALGCVQGHSRLLSEGGIRSDSDVLRHAKVQDDIVARVR